jgi:glycosyltransferase involved in cell wall biosynthesis
MTRIALIIPAYNEARVISQVLRDYQDSFSLLPENVAVEMIVIDDGSVDRTADQARAAGTRVISHFINLGLGGSISTGLQVALEEGFDGAVTADADGQHHPKDVRHMIDKVAKQKADFIVGSRWLKKTSEVPIHRLLGNKYVMNTLTFLFTGAKTSDSQSGLRGFSRKALEKINLPPQRMEVSTELFAQARQHQLRYQEVPIKAIYTDYSMAKGQRTLNGLAIVWRLTLSRLR